MKGLKQKFLHLSRRPEARHVGILTSGSIVAQVVLLATTPWLSRLFAPESFGLFSLMLSISTIGGAVGGIPLQVENGLTGYLVGDVESCAARSLDILLDPALGKAIYKQYFQMEDSAVVEQTYDEYAAGITPLPYISESGLAALLADLTLDEPRLAGRQPSEWVDTRFLRELESTGVGR